MNDTPLPPQVSAWLAIDPKNRVARWARYVKYAIEFELRLRVPEPWNPHPFYLKVLTMAELPTTPAAITELLCRKLPDFLDSEVESAYEMVADAKAELREARKRRLAMIKALALVPR